MVNINQIIKWIISPFDFLIGDEEQTKSNKPKPRKKREYRYVNPFTEIDSEGYNDRINGNGFNPRGYEGYSKEFYIYGWREASEKSDGIYKVSEKILPLEFSGERPMVFFDYLHKPVYMKDDNMEFFEKLVVGRYYKVKMNRDKYGDYFIIEHPREI